MKTPIRCMVVDDEQLARTLLDNYIAKLPSLNLVARCKDAMEASAELHRQQVDLLFLDIEMPEFTGLEWCKTLSRQKPLVVFTSAYAEYALEGYELDVVDYLLKPIRFDRLGQAVNKAARRLETKTPGVASAKNTEAEDCILVKAGYRTYRLHLEDILYIQSMKEYAAFYTQSLGRILTLRTMKKLESELPGDAFIRIHKSFIVARDKVQAIEGSSVTVGGEQLPVGVRYKERVMKGIFNARSG